MWNDELKWIWKKAKWDILRYYPKVYLEDCVKSRKTSFRLGNLWECRTGGKLDHRIIFEAGWQREKFQTYVTETESLSLESESRDSSVGIVLGYGLDDRGSRARFPADGGNFSLHYRVQNGSEAYPASHPMDTRGSFPGG
jgi:hypothetical protein